MLVDCQTCPVRDVHCAECVVTALNTLTAIHVLGADGAPEQTLGVVGVAGHPPRIEDAEGTVPLDRAERRAVSTLLAAGLVSTTAANSARAVLDEEFPARRAGRARRAV